MPATYGAAGTIVGGTLTAAGTFTFSVHVTKFGTSTPSTNGTYSITVGRAPPLTITTRTPTPGPAPAPAV